MLLVLACWEAGGEDSVSRRSNEVVADAEAKSEARLTGMLKLADFTGWQSTECEIFHISERYRSLEHKGALMLYPAWSCERR